MGSMGDGRLVGEPRVPVSGGGLGVVAGGRWEGCFGVPWRIKSAITYCSGLGSLHVLKKILMTPETGSEGRKMLYLFLDVYSMCVIWGLGHPC